MGYALTAYFDSELITKYLFFLHILYFSVDVGYAHRKAT
jgi:hypothetical protein